MTLRGPITPESKSTDWWQFSLKAIAILYRFDFKKKVEIIVQG